MLKHYLIIAFRNIFKQKGNSIINITGLAVGLAACLLLFSWLRDELSYDRYHEKADLIYRVISQYESDGYVKQSATTAAPLGPALVSEFPAVEKTVRFGENGFLINCSNNRFYNHVFFSDPGVFEVFNLPLVQGNGKTALKNPKSIIISQDIKNKYFGEDDPIGEIINLNEKYDFKITGVFENIPHNSHFRFDFLGTFRDYAGKDINQWGISNYYTYILTSKDFHLPEFRKKLPGFVEKYRGKDAVFVYKTTYPLQPLTRIHLHSNLRNEISPNVDMRTIYVFSAIGLFILFIACLNYIHLSTAMYIERLKEFGLRKVFGAVRPQLLNQFLCEALLFSLISLPLAVIFARLFLPLFNSLTGKQLDIVFFNNSFLITGLFSIILCVGIVSAFFPAVFILNLHPLNAVKGMFKNYSNISLLRKSLVLLQFTISIVFIINTLIIWNQLNYMKNKNLGFQKENILNIPIFSKTALRKCETIKNEFLADSNVKAVSACAFIPGKNPWYVNYWREGIAPNKNPMISCIIVDHDFLETFRIRLLKGRDFLKNTPGDIENAYILNNSAVQEMNWRSPIGKKFKIGYGKKGTVVGVVEDFHFRSLHHKIKPLALYIKPPSFANFSVRIAAGNIPHTLEYLANKWQELVPGHSFEYSFFGEDINNVYKSESKLGTLFSAAAFFAVVIAGLGLFGLAAIISEPRKKEIGIRKVLGASSFGIFLLLSKEFTRWVLVSNIIAWPIAWYAMNNWLQNFAYRTGIGIWPFLLAGLLAFFIALVTLSYKSIRAAVVKPVQVLRHE